MVKLWSLNKEKELAEEVQKHSVIYSKVDRINDVEDNAVPKAWDAVAKSIDRTVPETMGAFQRLKKRYLEKRANLRKLKHNSGGRTEKVEKAEKALAEYDFISWVMDFTVERSIRFNDSHLECADDDNNSFEDEKGVFGNGFDDDGEMSDTHIVYPSNFSSEQKCDLPSMVSHTGSKRTKPRSDLSKPLFLYTTISNDSHPISHVTNTPSTVDIPQVPANTGIIKAKGIDTPSKSNSNEDQSNISSGDNNNDVPQMRNPQLIFGEMVAAELTDLSSERRNHAKHEINNILYKYSVEQEEENRLKQRQRTDVYCETDTTRTPPQQMMRREDPTVGYSMANGVPQEHEHAVVCIVNKSEVTNSA